MGGLDSVSTGMQGLDEAIDMLRLGDNVVWQVDCIEDYMQVVKPYVEQAQKDGRNLHYIRFGRHPKVIEDLTGITVHELDAGQGFESFVTAIHRIIGREGKQAFYVFDCLTELMEFWYSDLMTGNFFRVTCPYLYELDTIAYFAIQRNVHTNDTIAGIRETTQLLLDVYNIRDSFYIHPLKVWQRYSPTMFFPHLIDGDRAEPITASVDAAELFASFNWTGEKLDFWHVTINRAREALDKSEEEQEEMKRLLTGILVGTESRIFELCMRYFKLSDIVKIASREIGTGFIGGKSVGMLLARRMITRDEKDREYFKPLLEPHDSYYLGSDIYYTYIVENGLWKLRSHQRSKEGYFSYAPELKEKLLTGRFPRPIREEFIKMLEYYGQSPIIVRSSSLLEDNFGNAFAGKYESVFCVNQGTPQERLDAFMDAVRVVYASTMNEDALLYRKNRGLADRDEQMAILVQRVSGDYYGNYFYPHIAGMGNSSNLYVWDQEIDMNAGMLRMVFGLGTRAVDRVNGDYVRIITLDKPEREPFVNYGDRAKYVQHRADVLDLKENVQRSVWADELLKGDIRTDKSLFAGRDYDLMRRMREIGRSDFEAPYVLDFKKLLRDTGFPEMMRRVLKLLSEKYEYPVDIEFTANFRKDGSYRFNLLQCRPLQTRGLGRTVEIPREVPEEECLFWAKGNFMGGNVRIPVDYVVFVSVEEYLTLPEREKYAVARQIGLLNQALKGKNAILMGPGRWGTTTPSLGVPVHFTELCNMSAICEIAYSRKGLMPELSYGSHFFQDLVEGGIFYVALFDDREDTCFREKALTQKCNAAEDILPGVKLYTDVLRVYDTKGMQLYSDIVSQRVLCSL